MKKGKKHEEGTPGNFFSQARTKNQYVNLALRGSFLISNL